MVAALAAYYYLLCWCTLLLGPVRAQPQAIPACSQLRLHMRSGKATLSRGEPVVLTAKLATYGARTLSGIGVRLDLPTGVVAERGQKALSPFIVNGGSTVYWTSLTLKPGKHRVLKLKARVCGAATPGSFPLEGVVYVVNATSAVTCMSDAMTTKPAMVRGVESKGWGDRCRRIRMDSSLPHTRTPVCRSKSRPARAGERARVPSPAPRRPRHPPMILVIRCMVTANA